MERLILEGYGKHIGRKGRRIIIKDRGSILYQTLPEHIRQIIIAASGSMSFQAVRLLSSKGVDLIFLNRQGGIITRLTPPKSGDISIRRAQFQAFYDERGVELAKEFVTSKIKNQIAILGTFAKRRRGDVSRRINEIREVVRARLAEVENIKGPNIDSVRGSLMGIEGGASSAYWSAIALVSPPAFGFNSRSGRPAPDPVNAMLNYGYAILMNEVWRVVEPSGLDPYSGFLHADKPSRPSLVLDLMEEFRQQIVDKSVVKLISRKTVKPNDFETKGNTCLLQTKSKRALLSEVLERLEKPITVKKKDKTWREIIHNQALKIAEFLDGKTVRYAGFHLRW